MVQAKYRTSFRMLVAHLNHIFPFTDSAQYRKFQVRAVRFEAGLPRLHSDRDFFTAVEQFLGKLHHGHTRLDAYPGKVWYGPVGYSAYHSAGKFYLQKNRLLVGQLIRINGVTPASIMRFHRKRMQHYRPAYQVHQAQKFLLLDHTPSKLQVIVRRYTRSETLLLSRRRVKNIQPPVPTSRLDRQKILHLCVPSWDPAAVGNIFIQRVMRMARRARGVIIDLRENGGGSTQPTFQLAGHFFRQPTSFGTVAYRKSGTTPRLVQRSLQVEPRRPYIACPICILTSIESQSSTEIFIAGLVDHRRAICIGSTTAGSSGNPIRVVIPFGRQSFTVKIARWRYRRPNGQWLERYGLKPQRRIPYSDRSGEMTLQAARRFILKSSADSEIVPVRSAAAQITSTKRM